MPASHDADGKEISEKEEAEAAEGKDNEEFGFLFFPDMIDPAGLDLKFEQQSPTGSGGNRFSFSRTSSTGSVHAVSCSSASSAHNTGREHTECSVSMIRQLLSNIMKTYFTEDCVWLLI